MDLDYFGILKGAAFSVLCLGGAFLLLRDARRRSNRNANRTKLLQLDEQAYCREGQHFVRRDWCSWDGYFNGHPTWVCHFHRLDRKRRAFSSDQGAA